MLLNILKVIIVMGEEQSRVRGVGSMGQMTSFNFKWGVESRFP